MKKTIIVLIAISTFFLHYTVIKSQDNIILFHSDTCGYCKDLLAAIEESDLEEILEIKMIEANEEGFDELFASSLEECDIDRSRAGFPTLYHNGDCSIGSLNSINTLLELAGIDTQTIEDEENNQITELEEVTTLQDVTETVEETPSRPFWHILAMLIGPAILLGIVYMMIKKLNL